MVEALELIGLNRAAGDTKMMLSQGQFNCRYYFMQTSSLHNYNISRMKHNKGQPIPWDSYVI